VPFTRKIINSEGTIITVAFSDDWNADCDLTEELRKEAFIQTLFTEFSKLIQTSDPCVYELASLTISESKTHYTVLLNEKDNFGNMYRLELSRLQFHPIIPEEKSATYYSILDLHAPLTIAEKKITTTLAISEKTFATWKESKNRLLLVTPKTFAEFEKNIRNLTLNFNQLKKQIVKQAKNPSYKEMLVWFQTDPSIQKAIKKFNLLTHKIRAQTQQKLRELSTLSLRLENILHEAYQAHITSKEKLFLLKKVLLSILQQTALEYYEQLIRMGNIKSVVANYFNDLFIGIAIIHNDKIQLDLINLEQLSLTNITDLFILFLERSNTFYNRMVSWSEPLAILRANIYYNSWIGVTTPLAILTKKITELPLEHTAPEYAVQYKYFKFTIPKAAYQLEKETHAHINAIKENLSQAYPALLQKEHCEICEIEVPSQRKLEWLSTRLMVALANHIEAKQSELARRATLSPTSTQIVKEVLTDIVEKVSEAAKAEPYRLR
jgi:hypothetical protein